MNCDFRTLVKLHRLHRSLKHRSPFFQTFCRYCHRILLPGNCFCRYEHIRLCRLEYQYERPLLIRPAQFIFHFHALHICNFYAIRLNIIPCLRCQNRSHCIARCIRQLIKLKLHPCPFSRNRNSIFRNFFCFSHDCS